VIEGSLLPFAEAHQLYLARTYAYVAAGKEGLAIVDIEKPEKPKLEMMFNGGGKINDAHDVKVGMTANSLFAYVADGVNGLQVVQLMSPEENPNIYGFSPKPTPKVIANYKVNGEALAISKGIDRDRAVDESGNQISVFNRRGARPFNLEEMQRLYLRDGQVYTVTNDVPARPRKPRTAADIGSIGTRLSEFATSFWARLTLGLLGFGVVVFSFQRKKPSKPAESAEKDKQ
jgi:hypothetical protein